jgi:hypothetical protein
MMASPVPAGSDVSAGTYRCVHCGYELQVESTRYLPPVSELQLRHMGSCHRRRQRRGPVSRPLKVEDQLTIVGGHVPEQPTGMPP